MDRNSINSTSCEVCYELLDNSIRVPRLYRKCGHTVCESCLKQVIDKAQVENKNFIKCHKCRQVTLLNGCNEKVMEEFPKNYSLIEVISRKLTVSRCKHESHFQSFMCLDNSCLSKFDFCESCIPIYHYNCSRSLIIKKCEFKEKVRIIDINVNVNSLKKYLLQEIVTETEHMKQTLLEFVNSAEREILKEQNRIKGVNAESFKTKFEFLTCAYDFKSDFILLQNRNKLTIENFAQELKHSIGIKLWEELKKKQNEQLTFYSRKFLDFKSSLTDDFEKLADLIENGNWLIKEQLWFSHVQLDSFKGLKAFYSKFLESSNKTQICFSGSSMANVGDDIFQKGKAILETAFHKNRSIPAIEVYLKNRFTEDFPISGRNWSCRVYLGEKNLTPPENKKWINYVFNGISVQLIN